MDNVSISMNKNKLTDSYTYYIFTEAVLQEFQRCWNKHYISPLIAIIVLIDSEANKYLLFNPMKTFGDALLN